MIDSTEYFSNNNSDKELVNRTIDQNKQFLGQLLCLKSSKDNKTIGTNLKNPTTTDFKLIEMLNQNQNCNFILLSSKRHKKLSIIFHQVEVTKEMVMEIGTKNCFLSFMKCFINRLLITHAARLLAHEKEIMTNIHFRHTHFHGLNVSSKGFTRIQIRNSKFILSYLLLDAKVLLLKLENTTFHNTKIRISAYSIARIPHSIGIDHCMFTCSQTLCNNATIHMPNLILKLSNSFIQGTSLQIEKQMNLR